MLSRHNPAYLKNVSKHNPLRGDWMNNRKSKHPLLSTNVDPTANLKDLRERLLVKTFNDAFVVGHFDLVQRSVQTAHHQLDFLLHP